MPIHGGIEDSFYPQTKLFGGVLLPKGTHQHQSTISALVISNSDIFMRERSSGYQIDERRLATIVDSGHLEPWFYRTEPQVTFAWNCVWKPSRIPFCLRFSSSSIVVDGGVTVKSTPLPHTGHSLAQDYSSPAERRSCRLGRVSFPHKCVAR